MRIILNSGRNKGESMRNPVKKGRRKLLSTEKHAKILRNIEEQTRERNTVHPKTATKFRGYIEFEVVYWME